MSSTLTSVVSSASSSPSAMSAPPSDSEPLLNTSTLLFGFLVSALSIFGVFMTFAIIWNRLVARRRAIEAMIALSPSPNSARTFHRPRMWDVWVSSDKKPPEWVDTKPLALTANCNRLSDLSRNARSEQTISLWKRRLVTNLPPEITYLFHHPIPPATPPPDDTYISPAELTNESDIQVSVLISMPRARSREREDESSQPFRELLLGTTNVVYHDPTLS